jgi:hypothetical protein
LFLLVEGIGLRYSNGGFSSRRFDIILGSRGGRTSSILADSLDNGSPANRYEIHIATRLYHEGIIPRIKRGIIYTIKGIIILSGLIKRRSLVVSL